MFSNCFILLQSSLVRNRLSVTNFYPVRHKTSISIILLNDVGNRGKAGEIIEVKRGYARNFLIPRKQAVYATHSNRLKFNKIDQDIDEQSNNENNLKRDNEIYAKLQKYKEESIPVLIHSNPNGTLFASINQIEIKTLLGNLGIILEDHMNITIHTPINKIGNHLIKIDNIEIKLEVTSVQKST